MPELPDDLLRDAIRSMPEAPGDHSFAARVLAVAAVTRQDPANHATPRSHWRDLFAGVMGLSLGAALLFLFVSSLALQLQNDTRPNAFAVVALEPFGDTDSITIDGGGS